jgi:hypothetical protein
MQGFRKSDILRRGKRELVEELKGPVGLILCGSFKSGEAIHNQLEKLIAGSKLVSYVTNGTETEGKLRYHLQSNHEFLIVTPAFALELFENWFDFFRFERYIVILREY